MTKEMAIRILTGDVLGTNEQTQEAVSMAVKALLHLDGYEKGKADAQPEIIRCKDCKHWGIHKWLNIPWCREMHIDRGAEDFCSNAERREDD